MLNNNQETKVYGIFGNPIKHSLSPMIQNTLASLLGHSNIYVPFKVFENNLQDALKSAYSLGILGINITIPHKKAVLEHTCIADENIKIIGAANTLKYSSKGYEAYNTDVYGLEATFDKYVINIENTNIGILGAGGGGQAAVAAVAKRKPKNIFMVNRNIENAIPIAKNIKQYYNVDIEILGFNELNSLPELELLIQATSVGLNEEKSPVADSFFFDRVKTALDIIYNPWSTQFLVDAKNHGCKCINGFDMLIFQAIKSYEIWNNIIIDQGIIETLYKKIINIIKGVNNA